MGQVITVAHERVADTVVFSADRSITGQAGTAFAAGAEIPDDAGLAGTLATRLFDMDEAVEHVWVASNTVVAKRLGGWSGDNIDAGAAVISDFFVYYRSD